MIISLKPSTIGSLVSLISPISTAIYPVEKASLSCNAKDGLIKSGDIPLFTGKIGWLGFPGRYVFTLIAFSLLKETLGGCIVIKARFPLSYRPDVRLA